MKHHFAFKNLIKKIPNVAVSKELIYFGIGAILVILVGMIAGNMYLQEMLLFEGIEKSTPFYTEEELREYGKLYKELEKEFEESIAMQIQTYANRTNRMGKKIRYGVYGQYNSEDLLNEDFVDGITIKYTKTSGKSDGDSNFQDILSAVAILIDQKQSKSEERNKDLIKALFNVSHSFSGKSTDLYPCTHGCFCDYYHCSDIADTPIYDHCNIKYQPFPIEYHDEYEDYPNEEDFNIVDPIGVCEVCSADSSKNCYEQRGCEQNGTCYHGDEEEHSLGRSEPTEDDCTNWSAISDCSDNPIGCAGYYQCQGHEHYECPNGHFYVCCMGHTNLTINIRIMYLQELINELKQG